jgi:myo-inositol catabolism protein IolC
MIDTRAMNLSTVARKMPGRNGHASIAAVSRWVSHGVQMPDGRRVRLRAVRIGQCVYVTPEALESFLAEMNPERPDNVVREQPPAVRRRYVDAACRQLEAMGA